MICLICDCQPLIAPSKCEHLCISRSFHSQIYNFVLIQDLCNICSVIAVKDLGMRMLCVYLQKPQVVLSTVPSEILTSCANLPKHENR